MIPMFARAFAIVTLLAVAGCSGGTNILPQARGFMSVVDDSEIGNNVVAQAVSPCKIAGFWYFSGSCKAFYVNKNGATVNLPRYKTFAVSTQLGTSFASAQRRFVAGSGTSDQDITGSFLKSTFPAYGSVACHNVNGQTVSCPGQAFLYVMMENDSSQTIGFNGTPKFTVTTSRGYPGTHCQLIDLAYSTATGFSWLRLPVLGKLSASTLTFKPWTSALDFPPGQKAVFGFACR
jgi:hypothetical protein